ncbi:hypothetical protein GOBAR_AA19471 [Gossypium barbadense]|uniref:Uncharacterized protein n=1 Tax=Gossypium barbadense TaxID=3634 RepID=A0A2P5XCX7_GOSBA|nr:hypothetical protein GOBAR_AA19471 [Gossypium barbadense]
MTGSEVIGFGVSKMVHLSSLELHLKEGVLASAETGNINEGTPNENRVQVPQHTRADPREEYMNSRTFHTRAWIQALRPNMQLESEEFHMGEGAHQRPNQEHLSTWNGTLPSPVRSSALLSLLTS